MDKKRKFISHYNIFDYWKDKAIKEDGRIISANEMSNEDVEIVPDYYEPCCWCCNRYMKKVDEMKTDILERRWNNCYVRSHLNVCHIIPFSKGGLETPDNLFLLCEKCHRESPDTIIPKYFFQYIYRKRKDSILGYFKSDVKKMVQNIKELCKINGKDFDYIMNVDNNTFRKMISEQIHIGSTHGSYISSSTLESIICEALPYKKDNML